ncbi:hypothetical protein BC936DRAFT_139792 [Jimgerdemannia flammicorona]|uniref:ADF-H domain-containing protein n=1 Tax=Jimgerdemannia flammicorona TaxID=994334 RepID=A0A433DHH8_9FUNG|nr:hypothetical protein BC936DRAFT_139792 [Jimgerdemannia flammicorona]
MSHQSGIKVSEELAQTFAESVKAEDVRIIRISIINGTHAVSRNPRRQRHNPRHRHLGRRCHLFALLFFFYLPSNLSLIPALADFDAIQTYLEPPNPAYVFYRLDTKSASSDEYDWLFLAYVPDNAKVRDKMLYASTRATLTKGLGDARFKDSVYGTTEAEFTLDGYKKHKRHQAADAPLTARERELAEIKAIEAKESFNAQGTTVRRTYAAGVAFPLSEQALEAVRALAAPKGDRAHNFVQLRIEKEIVELTSAEQIETANLVAAVPGDAPRFTLHQVEYEVQGEVVEALVFIYTCPSTSKIRDRTLYSSSRASVVAAVEAEGLVIAKKLETNDPSELTATYLREEVHPAIASGPQGSTIEGGTRPLLGQPLPGGFKRPAGPKRRPPA